MRNIVGYLAQRVNLLVNPLSDSPRFAAECWHFERRSYVEQSPPPLSLPKYRSDIDGLRALAVLAVVAFHAFPKMVKGGFIGVDVFFVISGYLISSILFENLEKGTFCFATFYARRTKRIFPALILVLVSSYLFGKFVLFKDEFQQLTKHIEASAGFIQNIVLWKETGYFDNAASTKPLLHIWSLGVEEQFYLAWPLLIWLVWRCRISLPLVTLLIAVISFLLNLQYVHDAPMAAFYLPQTRFWELLCGSLIAWSHLHPTAAVNALHNRLFANILSIVGFTLIITGFARINMDSGFPGTWALIPVAGTVLIILSGAAWLNQTLFGNKIAVWFGLISYPLYLWHWPLLAFAHIIQGEAPSPTYCAAAIAVAIILSWLTYRLIEKPLRQSQRNWLIVPILSLLITTTAYVALLS